MKACKKNGAADFWQGDFFEGKRNPSKIFLLPRES